MNTSVDYHDVSKIFLNTKTTGDGSVWVSIVAEGTDGKRSEVTFWALKGEALPILIGDE